jgi:hypothetical protein
MPTDLIAELRGLLEEAPKESPALPLYEGSPEMTEVILAAVRFAKLPPDLQSLLSDMAHNGAKGLGEAINKLKPEDVNAARDWLVNMDLKGLGDAGKEMASALIRTE